MAICSSTRLRVIVLVQRPESWANVEDVVRCLRAEPSVELDVLALPYDYSRKEAREESARSLVDYLAAQGELANSWTTGMRPPAVGEYDVAVLTAPYDRERPPEFHFREIAGRVRRTVYIPYGLAVGAGKRNLRFQFGQATQRDADLVVARSGLEKSMYERHCPTGSSHVRVLGSPRLDRISELRSFPADPELLRKVQNRKVVLWNSHFSFHPKFSDGLEYSTFDRIAAGILHFAARTPELALVWRPHPRLFREILSEGLVSRSELANFKDELSSAGVIVDERLDHRHAFAVADALMTDLGSFLVEFLATGKPLLYLSTYWGEGPNEEGKRIIDACETAENTEQAIEFISRVMRNADPSAPTRNSARQTVLPLLDGRSADRIAEEISRIALDRDASGLLGDTSEKLFTGLASIAEQKRRRGPVRRFCARIMGNIRAAMVHRVKESRHLLRWFGRQG